MKREYNLKVPSQTQNYLTLCGLKTAYAFPVVSSQVSQLMTRTFATTKLNHDWHLAYVHKELWHFLRRKYTLMKKYSSFSQNFTKLQGVKNRAYYQNQIQLLLLLFHLFVYFSFCCSC